MANELTKFLNTKDLPSIDGSQLAGVLAEAANDAMTSGGGNIDYLSFSGKTGKYALGRNHDEIDPDQLYLVETRTFIAGYVCWKNSKPIDRIEWSIIRAADPMDEEQAVEVDDLEDHSPYRENAGEGWQQLLGCGLIACDAMHSQVKFSSTSKSGRNSIADLMHEIGARAEVNEPSMPLIYFDRTTFQANGATNYKPLLAVEAWVTRESAAAYFEGSLSEEKLVAGHKPRKKRSRKR
jgi:hypothetical protein